jgi:hypothetical protein
MISINLEGFPLILGADTQFAPSLDGDIVYHCIHVNEHYCPQRDNHAGRTKGQE